MENTGVGSGKNSKCTIVNLSQPTCLHTYSSPVWKSLPVTGFSHPSSSSQSGWHSQGRFSWKSDITCLSSPQSFLIMSTSSIYLPNWSLWKEVVSIFYHQSDNKLCERRDTAMFTTAFHSSKAKQMVNQHQWVTEWVTWGWGGKGASLGQPRPRGAGWCSKQDIVIWILF